MENKNQLLKLFKQIASVGFVLSFVTAVIVFTGVGSNFIPVRTAKYMFIAFGGIAILFNLLSFERGKHNPTYSFIYWTGVLVTFFGLVAKLFLLKYNAYIMIAGMIILGASFTVRAQRKNSNPETNDLLDN